MIIVAGDPLCLTYRQIRLFQVDTVGSGGEGNVEPIVDDPGAHRPTTARNATAPRELPGGRRWGRATARRVTAGRRSGGRSTSPTRECHTGRGVRYDRYTGVGCALGALMAAFSGGGRAACTRRPAASTVLAGRGRTGGSPMSPARAVSEWSRWHELYPAGCGPALAGAMSLDLRSTWLPNTVLDGRGVCRRRSGAAIAGPASPSCSCATQRRPPGSSTRRRSHCVPW